MARHERGWARDARQDHVHSGTQWRWYTTAHFRYESLTTSDIVSVVLRTISSILLLQTVGLAIYLAGFGHLLQASLPVLRRAGLVLALAAGAAVVAHYLVEAARMAGEMSAVFDLSMQTMALHSPAGTAATMRLLGLTLLAVGLWRTPPVGLRLWPAILGAVLAIAAFTLTGHTVTAAHRSVSALILVLHLAVIAFWLGALLPLRLATLCEEPAVAGKVVAAFSAVAIWLVPLIALAGVGLMLLLLPDMSVLLQPYGGFLLWKIGLYVGLMGLAALNKWLYGPGLTRAAVSAAHLRRTIVLEFVLICVVLGITAVMTAFYSPEAA